MNNTYKERYYEIIKELREKKYDFFERFEETIVLPYDKTLGIKPQEKRVVVKLRINGMLLCNAYELAKIKAKYTNDKNQSGKERPMDIKIMNQLKGILAEIGVQLILEEVLGLDDVKRWDLERESFEYSTAEYDLKFSIGNKEYFCESRSSTSYKTTLSEFLSTCHVIGPYTSEVKKKEEANDYYFRPVFQYKNLYSKEQEYLPYDAIRNTFKDIVNGNLSLYFISGATKSDMFGKYQEIGSNKQSGTTYRQIRMNNLPGLNPFLVKLRNGIC